MSKKKKTNTPEKELKAAGKRILETINVNKIQDEKHLRMVFKRNHKMSEGQTRLLDTMVEIAFHHKTPYTREGKPWIGRGNYVPNQYYKAILLRKTGQVVRQAKTDIWIGEKFYRKGMFIPIYKEYKTEE